MSSDFEIVVLIKLVKILFLSCKFQLIKFRLIFQVIMI